MGKKEAWILILVIMPVFSRWWGVRGMGSPSSFVPSSSSNSFGVFFSPSSSFIPSSIHDSYVISSISSSCLVDCCESTTSVSFSPILNPPSSFSPTPVYSTSHSASLSSLSFTSNSFSLSLSSSSNEDDHLIRRKRDFGYFKRYIEGMEKCDRTGWGYWWEESCDNIAHCPDLKDETLCSCDMMVPLEYICDGYLDCPDLTDERGCKGCNRDELSCVAREGEEQVCVRPWQLCDGVAQCFDGEDEAFCWRLESTPEDVKGYVSFRSSGYLQVKREQEWRPVCLDADHNPVPLVTYFCDLVVGDRYNKDVHKVEAVNKSGHVSTTKWARYEDMGVQVEVADSCEGGHVLEITCGEPGCFAGEGRVNIADKQDKRVVGGGDASPFQWPFIVAILKNSVYSCGGTIVTSSAILTAAHCIDEGPASYYEIQAGMLRRNSWSPFEQSRKVSQILPHPSYTGLSNDVALFLLEAPLHLNRWVRPVCLSEALYPKMDQICTVAGWGTLQEGGDTPKKLQELDLPVLSTCLADTHLSDEQVLCAGYPEGKMDACQGDSGGPLMCGNEENGTWEQVGVVSFGEGCARAGNAGVYARVTYFSTWIIKTAGGTRGVSKSVEVSDKCSGLACRLMEGTCLPHASVCDGVVDCFKGEDEDDCLGDYEDCDDCSYYSDYNYDYDEKVKEDIARAASPASYYRPASVLQGKSLLLNFPNAQFAEEENGGVAKEEKGGVAGEEKGGVAKDDENEPPGESENEHPPRENQSPQDNGYHQQSQPQQLRENESKAHFQEEQPSQPQASEPVSSEPQLEPTENVPEEENVFPFLSEPESENNRAKEGGYSLPLPEPELGGNEYEEEYHELMTMNKKLGRSIQGRLIDTATGISTAATIASTITTSITATTDTGTDTTATAREQNQCAAGSVTVMDVLRVWNETECSNEEYKCSRLPECVQGANLCDGTRHCTDGTDEMRCQCRDRMLGTGRSDLICDGHPDCPDGSDEECDTCDGQFQCAISLQCVLASQVCDTHKDCRFGEDERECLLLYNKTQVEESVVKGTLALREGPRWKSLCLATIPERLANHVCRFLGYSELGGIDYTQAPIFTDPVSRVSTSYNATSNSSLAPPATPVLNIIFPEITSTIKAEVRERKENGNKLLKDVLALKGNDPDNRNPAHLSVLKDVLSLRHFTKRGRTCRQAVLTCQVEACGKVPLYYFSKETPVWRVGGVPWAAGVYVDGVYRCGGTLVRPQWVVTSAVCLAGINLRQEVVMVVMGSFRRLGTPTRIFGSHEKERRVDLLKRVKDSDILLLRLAHKMPKTDYINHLCLPESAPSLGAMGQCTVAGENIHHGKESVGVPLTLTKECEAGNLCILPREDFETCTESWAGILACQPPDQYNPTWQAVGVWTYRAPSQDGECRSALSHPRLTNDHLATMHAIFMDNEKTQTTFPEEPLMECDGRLCATGVCVTSQQECDARLDCPDLTDELSTCQLNVTTCLPEDVTVNVTANFTMECKCLDGGWACRNGVCLPMERVCDGVIDCEQGEDEEDCSCCRIVALRTPERICDRTVDCDDGRDEKNCSCDAVEEFKCYRSEPQLCLERERVCDGKKDCQQGEDEGICVTLAPNMTVLEDEFGRPKDRSPRGYLIVRLAGAWYTFIYSRWETYLSHLICLQLGYLFAKDTTFRNTTCMAIGKEWLEEERMVVVKELMEDAVVDVVWIDCETDNKPMKHLIRRSVPLQSVLEGDGIRV